MTNEAVQKQRISDPINFPITEVAVEKGTLMQFSGGDKTVKASSSTDVFAGIMRREKIAGDGRTQAALFFDGVWDLRAGGNTTITAGELVKLSGANLIEGDVVEADIILGEVVGKALEGVTVGTAKTIEVLVGVS